MLLPKRRELNILECQRSIHKKINKEIIVEETDTSTVK